MLLIYNILSLTALIVYLPWLLFKKGPEDRFVYLSERLGMSRYTNADIWVHAVSVGEGIAALPFMRALKKEFPEIKIVFSTTTYTGQKIARENFHGADRIMYMPWDTGFCIKRVVRALSPKIFITVETELWPVLFKAVKSAGANVILLNGRLSLRSYRGYALIRFFMRKVLSGVDFLYMQGKGDVERVISLGAKPEKVGLMGNFKFDVSSNKAQDASISIDSFGGRVMVAGSTHKGEEEIILDAYEIIRKNIKDFKLVLAPRHPERFLDAEEMLKKRNIHFIRRSDIKQGSGTRGQGPVPGVILLDTIGELFQIFSKADVVFVGGSLVPLGGHNILEPAYWGRPVVFGPYMDNFPVASEFLSEGAALMAKNSAEIASAVAGILGDTGKAQEMGRKAKAIVDRNTGAVEKAFDLVRSFIGTV